MYPFPSPVFYNLRKDDQARKKGEAEKTKKREKEWEEGTSIYSKLEMLETCIPVHDNSCIIPEQRDNGHSCMSWNTEYRVLVLIPPFSTIISTRSTEDHRPSTINLLPPTLCTVSRLFLRVYHPSIQLLPLTPIALVEFQSTTIMHFPIPIPRGREVQ